MMKAKIESKEEFYLIAETIEEQKLLYEMYCKNFFSQGYGAGVCVGQEDAVVLRFYPSDIGKET